MLAEILERTDQWLERSELRDERADGWLAADAIAGGAPSELHGAELLIVRGLTRWEPVDLRFFEALHQALCETGGRGLAIELPSAGLFANDAPLEPLARKLEQRWASHQNAPNLRFVEPADGSLRVIQAVEAQHAESEARAVVNALLESLSQGVPIDAIAVVSLDMGEAFLEPLRAALMAAKIPFSEPRGRPAVAAPHTHAALELMRLASGPLSRDTLLDVLRTPDLKPGRWVSDGGRTALWRWISALQRIPLRIDRSGRELVEALANDNSAPTARAAMERLLQDRDGLGRPGTRAELRTRFSELLSDLGLLAPPPAALGRALHRAESGDTALLRALADDARGSAAMVAAFDKTTEAAAALGLADEAISLRAYLEEVEGALPGVGPAGGPARVGALSLLRPRDIAAMSFELCVVCRASTAHLDAGGSDLVLGEELLAALPNEARPPSAADSSRFAELELAWALANARRTVVTFSRRDERGSPDGPSRWLRSLGVEPRREPASALHPAASRILPLCRPTLEAARRADIEKRRLSYFLNPGTAPNEHTGLARPLGNILGGDRPERPLSVTLLERYLRCSFLAFSALLGATRDEKSDDTVGLRERGSLLHAALAEALSATIGKWHLDSGELEKLAVDAAREYLAKQGNAPLRQAGLSMTLDDVLSLVRWSIHDAGPFRFVGAEQPFGAGRPWPPLRIGDIYLSGRIDRIDLTSDGSKARIIDYKSGKAPTRDEREQQLLQPWLYAVKVREQLGVEQIESGYLLLNRRQPKWSAALELNSGDVLLEEAVERAARVVNDFLAGRVEPRPANPRSCLRCDTRDICRRPLSAPPGEDGEGE
jgi:CRISPR/Cas system-associated exonuclease Cas4 (RecB family)